MVVFDGPQSHISPQVKLLGVVIHEEAVKKDHNFEDLPHGIHAVGVKGMTTSSL